MPLANWIVLIGLAVALGALKLTTPVLLKVTDEQSRADYAWRMWRASFAGVVVLSGWDQVQALLP